MSKEYPLLFPELVEQFNSIDQSNDEDSNLLEDEWDEDGINYKIIEYEAEGSFYNDFS